MTLTNHRVTAITLALLALASCRNREKELAPPQSTGPSGETVCIRASLEQPALSKTSLQEMQVVWTAGDRIKVFTESDPNGVVFTLNEASVGTTVGEFTGEMPKGDGPYYAVYPGDAALAFQEGSLSVSLPSAQTYVAESFGNGANLAMAVSESLQYLSFRNALGGVSFAVTGGAGFSGILLQAQGGEPLSGAGRLKMEDDEPVLTMEPATPGASSILLDCSQASGSTYYLMVPPGSFKEGFLAEFIDTDGNAMFRQAKAGGSNTVVRSDILAMPETTYEARYKAAFFASEAAGLYPSISAAEALDSRYAFDEKDSQYAFHIYDNGNQYLRVQSKDRLFAVGFTTPVNLALGQTVIIPLTEMHDGKLLESEEAYRLLRKSDRFLWFAGVDNGKGIVQKVED